MEMPGWQGEWMWVLWVCGFVHLVAGGEKRQGERRKGETWDMGHGNMGKAFWSKSGGLGERQ